MTPDGQTDSAIARLPTESTADPSRIIRRVIVAIGTLSALGFSSADHDTTSSTNQYQITNSKSFNRSSHDFEPITLRWILSVLIYSVIALSRDSNLWALRMNFFAPFGFTFLLVVRLMRDQRAGGDLIAGHVEASKLRAWALWMLARARDVIECDMVSTVR